MRDFCIAGDAIDSCVNALKHAAVVQLTNRDEVLAAVPATWKYKKGEVSYFPLTDVLFRGNRNLLGRSRIRFIG